MRPAFTAASLTWHAMREEPFGLSLRVVGYPDAVALILPLAPDGSTWEARYPDGRTFVPLRLPDAVHEAERQILAAANARAA
jgi:hypothetical protein